MLYNCYMPGHSLWNLIGIGFWFLIGVAAIIKVELWAIRREKGEITPNPVGSKSSRLLWVLLGLSVLSLTPLPEHIVLSCCRPQLEKYAHEVEQRGASFQSKDLEENPSPVAVVGGYQIIDSALEKDGAVYLVTNVDHNQPHKFIGLAFNASHNKDWTSHARYHIGVHLDGDWYVFEKN